MAEVQGSRAAPEITMSAAPRAFSEALVPCPDWSDLGASDHCMLVYDEEAHLLGPAGGQRGMGMRR
jgi:hypothetical protein